MRLFTRLATHLNPARREPLAFDHRPSGRRSLPELARAALKPGQTTWLIAWAVTLRGF